MSCRAASRTAAGTGGVAVNAAAVPGGRAKHPALLRFEHQADAHQVVVGEHRRGDRSAHPRERRSTTI